MKAIDADLRGALEIRYQAHQIVFRVRPTITGARERDPLDAIACVIEAKRLPSMRTVPCQLLASRIS